MALLQDPTIQRILDEVNRAATGGVLGTAGNYISDSMNAKNDYLMEQQKQQIPPLFYPTPDMFDMNGMTSFDQNMDFSSLQTSEPVETPTNFDLYTNGLYDSVPRNLLSPYDIYKNNTNINNNNNQHIRPTSTVSSTHNDILLDQHRHDEYPTIPPQINSCMPNLGLNLRSTPTLPLESTPVHFNDTNEQILSNEPATDTATATMDLLVDKDDNQSLPPNDNDEINLPEHISSAGRIFYDPNPQIVQRKGSNSVTYKQNIIVRFLQPPPIPNAGPLVIKEIKSQPAPALPPLVIKQRPSPPKTPPPLIIREKPPPLPSCLATKVITRHLPPDPAPARAVIIERLPPLPPKPRDIIIERWLPYEVINQKRKVVIERVQNSTKESAQPKNVIITYEPVHAKVERHFQKQNVIREDPQAYISRFGEQLCDSSAVLEQARAAGVLEDLNPPSQYLRSSTNNIAIGTDYEIPTAMNSISVEQQEEEEEEEKKIVDHDKQDIVPQEDDVLVEENVTPFYMNSGEDLQQTFRRLGIEVPETVLNEHHF